MELLEQAREVVKLLIAPHWNWNDGGASQIIVSVAFNRTTLELKFNKGVLFDGIIKHF